MKQPTSANLALIAAVLAWPLIWFGVLSQLGDYAPNTPREVMASNQRTSMTALVVGLVLLLGSLWLSGYSFANAKVRSVSAALLCLSLPTALLIFGW